VKQFRRIVVALDGSPTSLAALEATAELAAAWGSEVAGLFVEDTSLLRMASLPFAREVGSHSGAHRAINPDQFEREFRSQAERARNTLWYVAERFRLTASFQVKRGPVRAELIAALSDADMLAMGKGGRSVAASLGLGTNARAVAANAGGIVLLFSHVARVEGPPAVVYDGSSSGDVALDAAAELARTLGTALLVLCPAEAELGKSELEEKAASVLEGPVPLLQFRQIVTRNEPDLARYVRSSGANTVVVTTDSSLLPTSAIETLLTRFFGPVMLVGGDTGANEEVPEQQSG
jgi:nucleotide-binding universal stress UspA family protein